MTRVVSVSCNTGPVKIITKDKQGDDWSDVDERTLQSGESATSITLTDTRRLVIEEVTDAPK